MERIPGTGAAIVAAAATLLGGCGGGGGGGASAPPQPEPMPVVTISGRVQYEHVPPRFNCQGLDFDDVRLRPVRQATVELLDGTGNAVVDSDVTADDGSYSVSVDADTEVFLRVRAELKRAGAPAWDVEVRDNFDDSMPAADRPPLAQRPMYVLDGSVFDAGNVDSMRDLTARSGWNASTSSYDGPRAAAPFAILDTIYTSMRLVLAEDPQVLFEPLDVFWSIHNAPTGTPDADGIDSGEIGTSFYRSDINSLFLLGLATSDTEEFDDHVIAHEWGHYFEDVFSRSDSIGGAHDIGDSLDMRVAFGEGWATALSGITLGSRLYCDTLAAAGNASFSFDIETPGAIGAPGWYNELSVMEIIYDLWDDDVADDDGMSIGFSPIYAAMTGPQAATPAFTSIFSFAAALKAQNPAAAPFIDGLLEAEDITAAGINEHAGTETNDADEPEDVLPVYTEVTDGTPFGICSNSKFDRTSGGSLVADGNKLAEHRYLRMTLGSPAALQVEVRTADETVDQLPPDDPDDPIDQSDPDILIFRAGEIMNRLVGEDVQGLSGTANEEVFTTPDNLPAGEYVMDLVEFRYQDPNTAAAFPERSCFDVTITSVP